MSRSSPQTDEIEPNQVAPDRPVRIALRPAPIPAGPPRLLFPGSFNPAHPGHLAIARIASARLGQPTELELSLRNVDKPTLDPIEAQARIDRLRRDTAAEESIAGLWLTSAPTFAEKTRLFPGATFVVGLDTLRRLADPSYHGDERTRDATLELIKADGAHLLVFFRQLDAVDGWDDPSRYPASLAPRLAFVPRDVHGDELRLSSTQLRSARNQPAGAPDQEARD